MTELPLLNERTCTVDIVTFTVDNATCTAVNAGFHIFNLVDEALTSTVVHGIRWVQLS